MSFWLSLSSKQKYRKTTISVRLDDSYCPWPPPPSWWCSSEDWTPSPSPHCSRASQHFHNLHSFTLVSFLILPLSNVLQRFQMFPNVLQMFFINWTWRETPGVNRGNPTQAACGRSVFQLRKCKCCNLPPANQMFWLSVKQIQFSVFQSCKCYSLRFSP